LTLGEHLNGRLFDIVVTIRCVINLPTWPLQQDGIRQISKAVKPGGLYLLSEGWREGWDGLNRMRSRAGLDPMQLAPHNRLLDRAEFEALIHADFEIASYHSLGWYLVMSRIFQPIYVAPQAPRQTHDINRVAAQMYASGVAQAAFEECDYAGVYVLRKHSL
jgi:hypothetical protein